MTEETNKLTYNLYWCMGLIHTVHSHTQYRAAAMLRCFANISMLIRFAANDASMLEFNKYNDYHVCLLSLVSMLTKAGNVTSFGLES